MSAQFDYQGFDVLSQWSGALSTPNAMAAYDGIAAAGSNSIGLSPDLFVATATSSQVRTDPTQSTSDSSLVAGIQAAQAKGLKVLLEPHIQGLDGTASADLAPTDPTAFFASYKAQIVHLATLAQANGVDTLSLGNEMSQLTGSAYRAQWLDIIAAVRQVYSGKLTYEAATNEASSVSFWDKVDTIGFNAYLSLSDSSNPSVADLEKAWTTPPADNYWNSVLNGQSLIDFVHGLATTYGKPLLITEVGYRSIAGAATNPGDWATTGTASSSSQANAYQAMFNVLQSQGGHWLAGLNLWDYSVGITNPLTDYSPVGKPAMAVVQHVFSGQSTTAGQTITGSAVADLVDVGDGNDTISTGLGNDVIRVGSGNDVIVAGPDQIAPLTSTTVTITGYGGLGTGGVGGQVALLVNGQQVGATATFTPASDPSGYQTYSFTFANPDVLRSLDLQLLNTASGANAMIRTITVNGAALQTSDVTNASAPGTFDLYANAIHLDASRYAADFTGAQTDNDLIEVGSGNSWIDGGAGLDTVVFHGRMSDYTLSRSGNTLTVADTVAGRDGQDTLVNVEALQFTDGTVAVASLLLPDAGTGTVTGLIAPQVTQTTMVGPSAGTAATPQVGITGVSAANATVVLTSGTTVLATATANSAGAYTLTAANLAAGTYALSVTASLAGLGSSASAAGTIVVGSAATIAAQIAAAPSTPTAVYITDPADPIAVSVAQLRAISPALQASVTTPSVAVTDTAAHVAAALDFLGTTVGLSSITVTDSPVFAVSQQAMQQILAHDGAALAQIQGGYSFAVSSTSATGAAVTQRYDATGALTSTQTVATANGVVNTYTVFTSGGATDTTTDAVTGATLTSMVVDASGKRFTQYGITGQPYASATYVSDPNGTLTGIELDYANGSPYSRQTTASTGTVTTLRYDTAGHLISQVVAAPGGSTDTTTFDASGAALTHMLADASGKQYTQYGITGQPYTSATWISSPGGVLTGTVLSYASGTPYSVASTASDGTVTAQQFDTAGHKTSQCVTTSAGAADTTTYAASGAALTHMIANASGKQFTQYGITGQPYATATYISDAGGTLTGVNLDYANGTPYSRQTTASNGTVTTVQYDTAGHPTSQVVATRAGSTDTTTYDASGATLTHMVVDASGKQFTQYGITGQPYASATSITGATGVTTAVNLYYASGNPYSLKTIAGDGTATTQQFDTAGHRTSQTIATPAGTTDTTTYDASGATLTHMVVSASGKQFTQYGITGQPYASATYVTSASGALTAMNFYYANGNPYSLKSTASDGTVTTKLFDTAGHKTSQSVTTPDGTTDATTYDASGATLTDMIVSAAGKQFTQYGITGQPYASATYVTSPSGALTAMTFFYANGNPYSFKSTAGDGTVTTQLFDTAGHKTSQSVTTPDGTTDATTYNASGATLTDMIVNAAGKRFTQYGITGQPYASATYVTSPSGALTAMNLYYANGNPYSLKSTASDGTITTQLFDTAGHKTSQSVTTPDGTTDATTYDASGATLTDMIVSAAGKQFTQYGITGQPYASATYVTSPGGALTGMNFYYANGNPYSLKSTASDGTVTTQLFDPAGHKTSQSVTTPNGTTDATTYDASGATLTDMVVDATGKHFTQYGITGQSYTSVTWDTAPSGVLQDGVFHNADGSLTARLYAAQASLTLTGSNETVTTAGGNTLLFGTTPFHDTIQNFHGGSGSGHDTIALSKSLVADFSHLALSTVGQVTTVTINPQHTIAITGGPLGAGNFQFV